MSPRTAPIVPGRSGPPIGGVGISAMTCPSAVFIRRWLNGEAALRQPLVDADRVERLERVALQRDAVADAAQLGAQVDEDDLDAALAQAEGEHAAGDAAADDEDASDLGLRHGDLLGVTESAHGWRSVAGTSTPGAGDPADDVVAVAALDGYVGDLAAPVEDDHPVGDLVAERQVVGDDHDRDALVGHPPDQASTFLVCS